VPTLFAEDIEGARSGLDRNTARAHANIQKLNRTFFMPELVDLKDAISLVKKPKQV
jgi:hypothetical protein